MNIKTNIVIALLGITTAMAQVPANAQMPPVGVTEANGFKKLCGPEPTVDGAFIWKYSNRYGEEVTIITNAQGGIHRYVITKPAKNECKVAVAPPKVAPLAPNQTALVRPTTVNALQLMQQRYTAMPVIPTAPTAIYPLSSVETPAPSQTPLVTSPMLSGQPALASGQASMPVPAQFSSPLMVKPTLALQPGLVSSYPSTQALTPGAAGLLLK